MDFSLEKDFQFTEIENISVVFCSYSVWERTRTKISTAVSKSQCNHVFVKLPAGRAVVGQGKRKVQGQ